MAVATLAEINRIWANKIAVIGYVYVCEDGCLYKGVTNNVLLKLNANKDLWNQYRLAQINDSIPTTEVDAVTNPFLEMNTLVSEQMIPSYAPINELSDFFRYNITILDGTLLVTTGDEDVIITLKYSEANKTHAYYEGIVIYNNEEYRIQFAKIVTVKKVDSGAGKITIDINGSNTIDGNLTYTLTRKNQSITAQYNYEDWYILSSNGISDSDLEDNYRIKTTSFTMTPDDWNKTFEFTSGGFTQNLLTAVGNKNKWIQFINASDDDILFDAYSTETIGNWSGDIDTTFNLLPGEVLKVISNGTNLRLI